MNRNLESGHVLTTGEKALLVMVVAGVFGYWAGFNVSSTSLPDPFPAAVAAAPEPAPELTALSLMLDPAAVEAEERNAKQDDPPAPTF
jgi:hypothetical protein